METVITVRKADGTTKQIRRSGHIVDVEQRRSIEASAARLGAEVIGWELVTPAPVAPKAPVIVSGRARRRFEQYNARRSGLSVVNTERCRGCGRIGDDGECGLGHY